MDDVGGVARRQTRVRGRRLWVVLVIGALVAVGVAVSLVTEHRRQVAAREAQERVDAVTTPVQDYLRALTDADVEALLTGLDVEALVADGINVDLLDEQAVAASIELAPITDAAVAPLAEVAPDTSQVAVDVTYSVGGELVDRTITVLDPEGDGTYVVDHPVAVVVIGARFEGLALEINGVAVTSGRYAVLPGTYELTTTTEYFTIEGASRFHVTGGEEIVLEDARPALDDSGEAAFQEALAAAVAECFDPVGIGIEPGCGLTAIGGRLPGRPVTEDDVGLLWGLAQVTIDNLEDPRPTLLDGQPTVATAGPFGPVGAVTFCPGDGAFVTCDVQGLPELGPVSIDMTDPELTVIWE